MLCNLPLPCYHACCYVVQATVQLNQSINGLVNGLQSAGKDGLAAFTRMEEKVMAMEAEAEAAGQVGVVCTLATNSIEPAQ